jgi:2-methylcitrate dehydratase PrpD
MNERPRSDSRAVQRIATYASQAKFKDLTELTVVRARQVVLDFLGITLGGFQTSLGRLTADYAAAVRSGSDASIIGDGRRSTAEGAAWANATISAILGMSETHRVCGHVASEVVATALAMGEYLHVDGKTLITAMAAGYEVFGVIQPAVRAPQRVRGLDHKSQVGTLASAITAGVVMGLDVNKMGHALALSADMACGTEQYVYDAGLCDTEGLTAGFGAANGISAARMADFGFKGPPGALDGPYGYYHAFGDGYDPSYLKGLGRSHVLAGTGFKPHAGCRHLHPAIDAALEVLSASLTKHL